MLSLPKRLRKARTICILRVLDGAYYSFKSSAHELHTQKKGRLVLTLSCGNLINNPLSHFSCARLNLIENLLQAHRM